MLDCLGNVLDYLFQTVFIKRIIMITSFEVAYALPARRKLRGFAGHHVVVAGLVQGLVPTLGRSFVSSKRVLRKFLRGHGLSSEHYSKRLMITRVCPRWGSHIC
eukprot:jgi/Botrbrau1/12369/Bobra.0239s0018.1